MRVAKWLVLMLPILLMASSSPMSSGEVTPGGHLLIEAVICCGTPEMVTLINTGADANFSDVTLEDGEGSLRFRQPLHLKMGETFTIRSCEGWFKYGEEGCLFDSSSVEKTGRFTLADTGDEISLYVSGMLSDVFVYGSGNNMLNGWQGPAFVRIPKGSMAQRISMNDADTCYDWQLSTPGRSDFPSPVFDAGVEPFTFPEEGFDRIVRELSLMEEGMSLAVYELSNITVLSHLQRLALEGKDIRILLEGSPVGGLSDVEVEGMRAIIDAGGDVRFIRSDDGFKRYDYLHCKYAVIDGRRVIVTSENWQDSSFVNNRGWGAVVQSRDMAEYMQAVFDDDFNDSIPDIQHFMDRFPLSQPLPLPETVVDLPTYVDIPLFFAKVRPVLCPDHGMESLWEPFASAERRIYIQQFYVEGRWLDCDSPITWMMERAASGVDVRLMLDSSWFSEGKDNADVMDALSGTGLVHCRDAVPDPGFQIIHNKGVIIDDTALVSSMNWVSSSFMENRELGILMEGQEVAEYYLERFLHDWGIDPTPPRTDIILLTDDPCVGRPVAMRAETIRSDSPIVNYSWDLDGDGSFDRYGEGIAFTIEDPSMHVLLRVTDSSGLQNVSEMDLDARTVMEGREVPWALYALTASSVSAVIMVVHRSRRRHRLK